MVDSPPHRSGGLDLERWLRSPVRRAVLVVAAVLLLSAATTLMLREFFTEREIPVDWSGLYIRQACFWGLWGLAGFPILFVAGFLARRIPLWYLLVLVQLPLSYATAWGVTSAYVEVSDRVFEDPFGGFGPPRSGGEAGGERNFGGDRGDRESGGERGDRGDREPGRFDRRRSGRTFSTMMPRGLLSYWVILAVGVGATAFLSRREEERQGAELRLASEQLKTELANAKLAALKSQLHPHFLFNALHTIGGLIREEEAGLALTTLSGLGDLLRATLDQGESQVVSLKDELQLAKRYLDIERTRFGDRLAVEFDAPEELGVAQIPALLLLPLVENAVQHGVAPRTEGGRVEVGARAEGDDLVLEVRDDGPGFPQEVLTNGTRGDGTGHIGLANTRARLEMLYGDAHELRLENPASGGALVRIRIPAAFSLED